MDMLAWKASYKRQKNNKQSLKIEMVVDTGAALLTICWADLEAIGYDPAVVPDGQWLH